MILGRCKWCGSPLEQALKGRTREFCRTTDCRKKYRQELRLEKREQQRND